MDNEVRGHMNSVVLVSFGRRAWQFFAMSMSMACHEATVFIRHFNTQH